MAFITRRKNGSIAVVARIGGRRRWKTARTMADAKLLRAEMTQREARTARDGGGSGFPASTTVEEYSKAWLKACALRLKPRSLAGYTDSVERVILPRFAKRRIRDITAGMVRAWLIDLADQKRGGRLPGTTLARDTCRNHLAALRSLLTAAKRDGLLDANPASDMGHALPRKIEREHSRSMTAAELQGFLKALDHPRLAPGTRAISTPWPFAACAWARRAPCK